MGYQNNVSINQNDISDDSPNNANRPRIQWTVCWNPGESNWKVIAKIFPADAGVYRFGGNGTPGTPAGSWDVRILLSDGAFFNVGTGTVTALVGVSRDASNYVEFEGTVTFPQQMPSVNCNIYINTSSSNYTNSGIVTGEAAYRGYNYRYLAGYAPPAAAQASRISLASAASLGDDLSISITADNTGYTHTLAYSMDNSTWTNFSTGTSATTAGTAYSVSFNTSTYLSSYFTTQTQRTVYIRCTTFNGSEQIGNAATASCVVTASGEAPTISVSCNPYNSNRTVSGWGIYLQTYSKVDISISYTLSAGSTFSSCRVLVDGVEIPNSAGSGNTRTAQSDTLSVSGDINIEVSVTDSRGEKGTQSATISIIPYSRPYISSRSALRYSSNENTEDKTGTNISAKATAGYSSIGGRNSSGSGLLVRYKESGTSDWSTAIALTSGASNHTKINGSAALSVDKSYVVQFIAYDALHPQNAGPNADPNADPTTVEMIIVTNSVIFHAKDGGEGFAVGGYCDNSKSQAFEVFFDTYLYGKLILPSQIYGNSLPSTGVEGEIYFVVDSSCVTPHIYDGGSWH